MDGVANGGEESYLYTPKHKKKSTDDPNALWAQKKKSYTIAVQLAVRWSTAVPVRKLNGLIVDLSKWEQRALYEERKTQFHQKKGRHSKSMEDSAGIREKRWSLQGTTALVTGGTKGIGFAIVEELAGLGATVYTCSENGTELNKCLQEWEKSKLCVKGSVCDVSSRAEREKLMEKVCSIFQGKLDILINNAGTGIVKPTVDCTAEEYSLIMATNFDSAFHLCQLAHPLLKVSGNGSIINISSIGGIVHLDDCSIYSATKGALNQLTKNLACEWAKDNIRTNCVAPGYIRTSLVQFMMRRLQQKKSRALLLDALASQWK